MKFGVREICDVVLRAKAAQKIGNKVFYKNEPVLYFDSLKTSSMEGAATTVYAQGGRGNARLIAWEGERTVTFTMEDALISPIGFSILTGAGLTEASGEKTLKVHTTETVKVASASGDEVLIDLSENPYLGGTTTSDTVSYFYYEGIEPFESEDDIDTEEVYYTQATNGAYTPVTQTGEALVTFSGNNNLYVRKTWSGSKVAENVIDNFIYVMRLDDNGEVDSEPYIATSVVPFEGKYRITIPKENNDLSKFNDNTIVLVDYYVEKSEGAFEINITPDKFGGNFYLEASTLFRDTNGVDMPAEFVIPNCKIQSNFTFTMASSGDPSTFTFTMDAFPDYTRWDRTKKVFAAIQVINTSDENTAMQRIGTNHDYGKGAGTDGANIDPYATYLNRQAQYLED